MYCSVPNPWPQNSVPTKERISAFLACLCCEFDGKKRPHQPTIWLVSLLYCEKISASSIFSSSRICFEKLSVVTVSHPW